MKTSWLIIFVILIFVFIHAQLVWLAVLLGMVICIDLLSLLGKTGKNAIVGFGKGAKEDLEREYNAMEKTEPRPPEEGLFVSLSEDLAKKTAENFGKSKKKKKNTLKSIGKGSKNLIKKSKKLFNK